jgi:glyoxylase-like metal-dependent hydrolase (beta-lactamase superfamily II)
VPNTFRIGDLEVLVVSDGYAKFAATAYYRGTTAEHWEPHKRWLDHEGNLEFPFSCFLVRSGDRRVLIDTGLGSEEMYTFHGGALLGELAAAGVPPEDIDTVFVTHLHVDHCGTCILNEEGAPRPTFPNAAYRWTTDEHAHWQSAEHPGTGFSVPAMFEALSGRLEPANEGDSLAPGVSVIATPGHTPGHAGVVLSSGADRAFILGDAISCPAQLEEAEWSGLGDVDRKLARRTQDAVAREIEESGALLATAHFPGLTFGRVLRGEGRRYWQPVAASA